MDRASEIHAETLDELKAALDARSPGLSKVAEKLLEQQEEVGYTNQLIAENATLRAQCAELESHLSDANATIERATTQHAVLQDSEKHTRGVLTEMEGDLRARLAQAHWKIAELEAQHAALTARTHELQATLGVCQVQLREAVAFGRKMADVAEAHERDCAEAETQVAALTQERDAATQQYDEALAVIRSWHAKWDEKEATQAALVTQWEACAAQLRQKPLPVHSCDTGLAQAFSQCAAQLADALRAPRQE